MRKENYQWLEKELPSWINEGIVTSQNASVLLHRYTNENASQRSSGMAFSVLGFMLVGLGIISILAYNWDELGHLERTVLAVGLLVSAQLFTFWVKRYKSDDKALVEGSGLLWFLMMGASLAIIGQTYHLGGTLSDFMSVWLLLSFAMIWIVPSSSVAFLQIILWTGVWMSTRSNVATLTGMHTDALIHPWLLLAMSFSWISYYAMHLKNAKYANTTLLLSWAVSLCLFFIFIVEIFMQTDEMHHLRNTLNVLALFFAIYYMAGNFYLFHGEKTWQHPFSSIGKLGALGLILFHISASSWHWMNNETSLTPNYGLLITLGLIYSVLLVTVLQKLKRLPSEALVMLTPFIFFAYTLLQNQLPITHYSPMFFINASLLLGASWMIICGAKESKIGLINQGMLLIALSIWIHFMDADFDLVAKGMAFIMTGILFLVANALIRRRFKVNA